MHYSQACTEFYNLALIVNKIDIGCCLLLKNTKKQDTGELNQIFLPGIHGKDAELSKPAL